MPIYVGFVFHFRSLVFRRNCFQIVINRQSISDQSFLDHKMFALLLWFFFVDFSLVYSNDFLNENLIDDLMDGNVLFLDKSANTGLLNPPLNQTLNELNEILLQLIKRIESNPILFNVPEFLKNFMNLMKKINEIVEKSAKSAKIDAKVKESLMKLDFSVSKLTVLMKTYAKIENIKPLDKPNDTSIPESFDYWSIIWKTVNKIESQLSKTSDSVGKTQKNGLNSDLIRNQLIFEVLSKIRNQLATNETLQKMADERSLGMDKIMARVMARVDSLRATITTQTPVTSRPTPNGGIIGSIFSRIRDLLINQTNRPIPPPAATKAPMAAYKNDIESMVKQIMEELFADNAIDLSTDKNAKPNSM